MSNPTPILNNINAFDATKGTTISFNIIGGTDIVRSNIVYIYDLSTNDLICTHLYISTESIHELPPNTDSSIVYASGKSSADFVNNKNYYLQIQTFTNTAGTASGSGMSVAKTFWCLFDPALSVNAIPAAISTTSYNVGATYNTNVTDTSIPVTNIIQQYKFDLYTATGTLVQTSGNIIGSGEQEGTSTTYNITYNFSGLVVNNSYYVVVTTTSTEGMTVSAQSNTFTVSIETPTVGAATATNNSCDGYISVVSNLSSEYGGSASGEIASFETDSVNNVSSLKVNMEPIQEGSGTPSPDNVRPISGRDSVSANVVGVNVWDEEWELGWWNYQTGVFTANSSFFACKSKIRVLPNTDYYWKCPTNVRELQYYDANGEPLGRRNSFAEGYMNTTFTTPANCYYLTFYFGGTYGNTYNNDISINYPSTDHDYHAYQGSSYTADLGQTVYGGTVDLVSGEVVVDNGIKTFDASEPQINFYSVDAGTNSNRIIYTGLQGAKVGSYLTFKSNAFAYELNSFPSVGFGAINNGNLLLGVPTTVTTKAEAIEYLASMNVQIVYELATPQTYQLTPQEIQTLVGQNNVWSDAGNVEVTFNLPITNLLVKRQDTSGTSGKWLTLYSQPITQASDMDFTYIDFLNQHGKTYRYALVPLLTQQQGDVDVEIEGGYTVSDDVLSVFDGVFIANSNGSQKLKANTEYGELETNQDVGVLTTIGGKYPFVVSNSNLNYHSGSISALIVPSDFYTSGDLGRLDIVERREAIEQFLTDKTAKILKDWNGNIWLITFVENVEVSFVDDYGMGLGTLSAKWVEIGDVDDQTDLQQTGLI